MAIISKSLETVGRNAVVFALTRIGYGTVHGISYVACKTNSGLGNGLYSAAITWDTPSNGSTTTDNAYVINISAGQTINYIQFNAYDDGVSDYGPVIIVAIDAEVFTYAGAITIVSATLTASSTLT